MNNPIFFTQKLETESATKGELEGIAYSGGIIPMHGPYQNLVVDVATLKIAKKKTPILRDHMTSLVSGHGEVTIDGNDVKIKGKLSKKSAHGLEIMQLAEEGFEWEMSLGVYEGTIEEVKDVEINGHQLSHGFVLRNGLLREVSIVALGADMNTNAQIFSQVKGENTMKLTHEQFVSLACACGGNKDTTPEELQEMVEKKNLMTDEQEAKVAELEKMVADLKEEIATKEAEIAAIKAEDAEAERVEEMSAAVKEKGIQFSLEKIKEAAKSKETTEILLSFIKDMKPMGKIPAELAGKVDLGATVKAKGADAIRLAAEQLVKEGKAASFIEALEMVEEK